MKKKSTFIIGLFLIVMGIIIISCSGNALSSTRSFTILHTNDLHSRLLPFHVAGSEGTRGGWARIATVIESTRMKSDHPVLVLDGGDFLMGTLFHTISREEAVELTLMYDMGYDAVTIGNHEYDLKPVGLEKIIEAAASKKKLPALVASNIVFSGQEDDAGLEKVFENGYVKPYTIIERDGLRFGIFGLMGEDAAEVAPFAEPVSFADPVAVAEELVVVLRNTENVDVVICLSHSGLHDNFKRSEDEQLARNVNGIDIIISGHSHTRVTEPRIVNDTIIVQAWAHGMVMGKLDVSLSSKGVQPEAYEEISIDETIPPNGKIEQGILKAVNKINERFLEPLELSYSTPVVRTAFDMVLKEEESTLGNFITDAMLWYANATLAKSGSDEQLHLAVISNGVIRDNIVSNNGEPVTVAELFNVLPLGIGDKDTLGYPLVALYVTGEEIKKALEILTSIYPLKGSDYFLQISGLRFAYNPNRMIFDRVTKIAMGSDEKGYIPLNFSKNNEELYGVVSDIYNATFLKIIGSFTGGLLTIVPKDRDGVPIDDLWDARIDYRPDLPGITDTKEWFALIEYVQTFDRAAVNSIADMPDRYRSPQGRIVAEPSWNPLKLVAGGTAITWAAAGVFLAIFTIIAFIVSWILRRRRMGTVNDTR